MTRLGEDIIPIEPAQPTRGHSAVEVSKAYRFGLRPLDVATNRESGSSHLNMAQPSAVSRSARAVSSRSTRKESESSVTPTPSSAYLDTVLTEVGQALRKADALRPLAGTAELSAAYIQVAARVFDLQMEAQIEAARLRAEGTTEIRQWLA